MYSFSLTTAVRGFHVYKDVWKPTIGEVLSCERDIGNSHDTFAVVIKNSSEVVSHALRYLSSICSIFLRREMKTTDILEQRYVQTNIIPNIAVKWDEIGLELDVPVEKIQLIKNETDHTGAQCLEMLLEWFYRGPNVQKESDRPIWKNMYDAMCAESLNARAEVLKELLLKKYRDGNDEDVMDLR